MNRRTFGVWVCALLSLSGTAVAQDEVLERVVVRNRLYEVRGRLEVSGSFGMMPVPVLVEHYNLNLGVGFNLFETLAVEARGGYALSRQTGLSRRIAGNLLGRDPTQQNEQDTGYQQFVDDLSDLWQMNLNAVAGLRWAPIYGKLSLMAELPVHFQFYLWAGGGVASFSRQSVVYCLSADRSGAEASCGEWLSESRFSPVGSGAVGFRFFTGKHGGIRIELRDYMFQDAYRTQIDRTQAEAGNRDSGVYGNHGWSHIVMFDLGYTFLF